MKFSKLRIISLLICLTFMMAGCGNSDKTEITQTVETFLTAATTADYETVSMYCSEDLLSDMGLTALNKANTENGFYEHLGIDKSILSEDTQTAVSEYSKFLADNLIQNYRITDVSETEGIGTVYIAITTYSQDAKNYISSDAFRTELSDLMTDYQNENLSELSSLYMTNGEEAMQQAFYNGVIPLILDTYKTSYNSYEPEEISIILIVEKVDDIWKITDGYLAEE